MNDVLFAFMLTLIAGLATGAGGLVVLFTNVTNKKFLSICLSFSAGVMLYIAFAEIFKESFETLEYAFGDAKGLLIVTLSFFAGILLMAVVDKYIPHDDEIDELLEANKQHDKSLDSEKNSLKRVGISSTIAVAIHNLPEGLITFLAALHDPAMGIGIALAIIVHNIPEGVAIAAPIYHATGSKAKAFWVSVGAGLTEPLGALLAWLLFRNIFEEMEGAFGISFAAISGIMVFVAIHQLLPAAHRYGKHHLVMKWLFAGMAVMALSIVALEFLL